MKNYRWQIAYLLLVLLLILAVTFLYGSDRTVYNKNDAEIGKNIIFSAPMLSISNLSEKVVKSYIANNYDALLVPKDEWEGVKSFYEGVLDVKIPCNEVFKVVSAFSIVPTGVLRRTFSSGIMKYYELKSVENNKKFVILEGHYEKYGKVASNGNITRGCAQ